MGKVLVVGGGAREHALVRALLRSGHVHTVLVAPGNAGTALEPRTHNVPWTGVEELVAGALQERVDLTVVGPEGPLAAGLVDAMTAAGCRVFGPTRSASQLETSKAWAKRFAARWDIPTAPGGDFSSLEAAMAQVRLRGVQEVVLKPDGLTGGKGVRLPSTEIEAQLALTDLLVRGPVVVEDRLSGPELSLFGLSDGTTVLPLLAVRDHKHAHDGDLGPLTGGMGAWGPVSGVDLPALAEVFLERAVAGLAAEGTPFTGVLYAGLVLTERGPRLLEYNVRLGDPEAQVLLELLDSDLYTLLDAAVQGRLHTQSVSWRPGMAAVVVLASEGYPDSPQVGRVIHGCPPEALHGGTGWVDGALTSTGGRVLSLVGRGDTLAAAASSAYQSLAGVTLQGGWSRQAIGS